METDLIPIEKPPLMTQTPGKKLRLMVVDDELDNLDLLYRTFRRTFEVFKADSAPKALEILAQEDEMAIIISDQRMPRMSGTELLSIVAEKSPDTIRILLTGYTDIEDLVGAINTSKVFKYITKPWNPDNLQLVVNQAAETYQVLKQRTHELHRALRRESLFNTITSAIRESLNYQSMLQTIAKTLGQTFEADITALWPVESVAANHYQISTDTIAYALPSQTRALNTGLPSLPDAQILDANGWLARVAEQPKLEVGHCFDGEGIPMAHVVLPLVYQRDVLAIASLYRYDLTWPWSDEDLSLLQGVSEQIAVALSQAQLHQRLQQQAEQMRSELAVARQIQTNLLRQSWPQLENLRIQACCHPAREVGGDFFEVYIHPQGDVWLAVGDVSGKGVPAALFMASAISLLRRELSLENPAEPGDLVKNLNASLSDNLIGSNCFITLVLVRYSPTTRRLDYANAGHIYPMVWSRRSGLAGEQELTEPIYLKERGIPLGILPQWRGTVGTLELNPGNTLLLTSDGITETTISQREGQSPDADSASDQRPDPTRGGMLQQEGLWKILSQEPDLLDLNHILAQIRAHSDTQDDDQTILALEIL